MVYGNVAYGNFDVENTVTHEFGHLLYHERHGFTNPYWEYHDEGLAECAVHAVWGINQYAVDFYQWDPAGIIGQGLSLVNWTYAQFENYVLGYLFWTYVASRLDGVPTYRTLFDLSSGDPDEVNAWLNGALGEGFPAVLREGLIANWAQAPTGIYGFQGMLEFPPGSAPVVPAGATSVDLEPFAGAFFQPTQSPVDYPGTEGPNIVYAGIDGAGTVDLVAPFEVAGGALLVFNQSMNHTSYPAEHSGPDVTAIDHALRAAHSPAPVSRAWLDPPPTFRQDGKAAERWRRATEQRLRLMVTPSP